MRTINEEEVVLSEYQDFSDAGRQLGRSPDVVYNRKRAHASLDYPTPTVFERQWLKGQSAECDRRLTS
jgi:hypothetical protein